MFDTKIFSQCFQKKSENTKLNTRHRTPLAPTPAPTAAPPQSLTLATPRILFQELFQELACGELAAAAGDLLENVADVVPPPDGGAAPLP